MNIRKACLPLLQGIIILVTLYLVWFLICTYSSIPAYLLPPPSSVFAALWENHHILYHATIITTEETLIGLVSGCFLGMFLAFLMSFIPLVRHWLMPVILISQSIPTFALAPLLVLWFGFGIGSKIVMTILMIFFPVTSAFFDGLNRTPQSWLELSKTMNATALRQILYLRIPAALPSFASGLRIAAAIAPIGAVVGEWVGASDGLGYLMQNANNRFQTDLMFAALFILSALTITLWGIITLLTKKLVPWSNQ